MRPGKASLLSNRRLSISACFCARVIPPALAFCGLLRIGVLASRGSLVLVGMRCIVVGGGRGNWSTPVLDSVGPDALEAFGELHLLLATRWGAIAYAIFARTNRIEVRFQPELC